MIIFRCDVSPEIGWGHFKRCLTIASYLKKYTTSKFYMSQYNPEVLKSIEKSGHGFESIPERNHFSEEIDNYPPNLKNIVLDLGYRETLESPKLFSKYLSCLLEQDFKIIVMDGLGEDSFREKCAPLVNAFIQPYWGTDNEKRPLAEHWLHGPKYVLIDKIYQENYKEKATKEVQNILITFGGSDPHRLTLKALKGIQELDSDFKIKVIVGPSFSESIVKELQHIASERRIDFVFAPENLLEQYLWADLCLCGSGITKYEAAAVGVPVIFTSIYDQHDKLSLEFESFGTAKYLGIGSHLNSVDWKEAVVNLKNSLHEYECMLSNIKKMQQTEAGGKILSHEFRKIFEI